tara:strand:- start:12 stop:482 length:471 start_codon:yes stop_codon:yes gene_type:complete
MSSAPNHLGPVEILLRDMQRQQTKQALDEQYKLLANQMSQEAAASIKELKAKKQKAAPDTLLEQLVKQGLAKVKTEPIKVSNKKGGKKLEDEITSSQYFKLTIDEQLAYDRKMATLYKNKGLGPYRSFKRKPPVNQTKKQRLFFNNYNDSFVPSYI